MSKIFFLITLHYLISAAACQTVKVILSSDDYDRNKDNPGFKLKNPQFIETKDITICFRFLEFMIQNNYLIDSATRTNKFFIYDHFNVGSKIRLQWAASFSKSSFNFHADWKTHTWNHICFSFEKRTRKNRMISNGMVIREDTIAHTPELGIPSDLLKGLFFMKNMTGKITDINIWNSSIDVDKMKTWTTCKKNDLENGNIINWKTAEWDLGDFEQKDLNRSEICEKEEDLMKMVSGKRNMMESMKICKQLKGTLAPANNASSWNELVEFSREHGRLCSGYIWTSYSDEDKENKFVDLSSGQEMSWSHWGIGQPNGNTEQNCVEVKTSNKCMNDVSCLSKRCTVCLIKNKPQLYLRGHCHEKDIDHTYIMMFDQKEYGKCFMKGWSLTDIIWNLKEQTWNLISKNNQMKIAYLNGSIDCPIGTHKWTYLDGGCHDTNIAKRSLNLHSCNLKEWPCSDGTCIPKEKRCDGKVQCEDHSDEQECLIVSTPEMYEKRRPPAVLELRNSVPKKQAIGVSINILKFQEFIEVESTFKVSFEIILQWRDSLIQFNFLKKDSAKNVVSNDEIWKPGIVFQNTLIKRQDIVASQDVITVQRLDNAIPDNRENVIMNEKYKGNENTLNLKNNYVVDFTCSFNLKNYPFDTQTCNMDILLTEDAYELTQLIPKNLTYKGSEQASQYIIKGFSFIMTFSLLSGMALSNL